MTAIPKAQPGRQGLWERIETFAFDAARIILGYLDTPPGTETIATADLQVGLR